ARLEQEKYKFWANSLVKLFDWSRIVFEIHEWVQLIPEKKLPDNEGTLRAAQEMLVKAKDGAATARKFQQQLAQITEETLQTGETSLLQQRMEKAVAYFADYIATNFLVPVQAHLKELSYNTRVKKYKEEILKLEGFLWTQLQRLLTASYGELQFFSDFAAYQRFNPTEQQQSPRKKEPAAAKTKAEKGSTHEITFELFREGKSIDEIATLRNLALSTVEGHLALFVKEGKIQITDVVAADKVEHILKVMNEVGTESLGLIKGRLGDEYTFGEIRAVLNHRIFSTGINA
ncbi:MAG: hypothetical protein EOO16_12045, partial [Chitinophagaceae bacterium]